MTTTTVPTEPTEAMLRDALSTLLSFTGQMTPRQFIEALYSIDSPGIELCDRDALIAKFDAAQAAGWSALAAAPVQSPHGKEVREAVARVIGRILFKSDPADEPSQGISDDDQKLWRESVDAILALLTPAGEGLPENGNGPLHEQGAAVPITPARPGDMDLEDLNSGGVEPTCQPRGFLAALTDHQRTAALNYRGEDGHGFLPSPPSVQPEGDR